MSAIENCSTKADVTGNNYVGGISGSVDYYFGSITDAIFEGNVVGNDYVGGLAGVNDAFGTSSGSVIGDSTTIVCSSASFN